MTLALRLAIEDYLNYGSGGVSPVFIHVEKRHLLENMRREYINHASSEDT